MVMEVKSHAVKNNASKVMLKILQARLQWYVSWELPDVQARFWKGRGTRDQIANIPSITEKQEGSRKTSTSALLTMPKPFDCVYYSILWKILRKMGIPDCLPASWEICVQVKKQQLELDMKQ